MKQVLLLLFCIGSINVLAQPFTRQDSLRGSITPEREWWDLTYYHLKVSVFPEEKRLAGVNTIRYQVIKEHDLLQVDLQEPMKITKVTQDGQELDFEREGNAFFVQLLAKRQVGEFGEVEVHFSGVPREAIRAPWDGGVSWTKDDRGNHFIATSCQGLGASVWWPNKDHMYDEVDSMSISVEVPMDLVDVSNGRLLRVDTNRQAGTKTYHWHVANPINNYGVNLNIGDYTSWKEVYEGEKGPLDVTYWALKQDLSKAKKQYKDVGRMLEAFEHWFGPYPFYEDGYQLVQAPYLGMEHQSSITYGNGFQNGYRGRDLSTTGWGMKFDFIIIHESGHEWFANNLTHTDIADMWLHESFTNYSESLFLEYFYGKEAGQEYVRGTRANIENAKPMIVAYGVNDESYPIDVYYKGGNMLNTLRTVLNDDEHWRNLLRGLGEEFYHKTTNTNEVEQYIANFLKMDLTAFFDQYLRDSRIPTFEYYFLDGKMYYRWINVIPTFYMPLVLQVGDENFRITPSAEWAEYSIKPGEVSIDPNYYIAVLKSRG